MIESCGCIKETVLPFLYQNEKFLWCVVSEIFEIEGPWDSKPSSSSVWTCDKEVMETFLCGMTQVAGSVG